MKLENELKTIIRGAGEVIARDELEVKLVQSRRESRPLRIKFGADPTTPDLHLGHMVNVFRLKQFQDLGHEAIYLIGDFTATIGDPSGRNSARPYVSRERIMENAKTYERAAVKILDPDKTRIVHNSDWYDQMTAGDLDKMLSYFTLAQFLQRDDFRSRLNAKNPLTMAELIYPVLQAYDSVMLRADVELGGIDQTLNFHIVRSLQKKWGQEPEVGITMPLLVGTDGNLKMSKSYNNYVAIEDSPMEMFSKIMSIPNNLIYSYFQLATNLSPGDIDNIKKDLDSGKISPESAKEELSRIIITIYHGRKSPSATDFLL